MVAAADDDVVQIIDIADPANPTPVSAVFDGSDGFDALEGAVDVEVFDSGGRTYATVAAARDSGIQIMDITDPARPTPVSAVFDGSNGFDALDGAIDVEVFDSGGRTYAIVAAYWDGGVQIMDITDPANPTPTSAVFDSSGGSDNGLNGYWNQVVTALFAGLGGFVALDGANDVEVFDSGGRTYAMVTAWKDGGVQIMDITDPANPTPTSAVFDGPGGFIDLDRAVDVEVFESGDRTYAMVISSLDNTILIMDITDPAHPAYDGPARFTVYAANDLEVFESGDRTYVMVATYYKDDILIMDITDPAHPAPTSDVFDDPESSPLWIGRQT